MDRSSERGAILLSQIVDSLLTCGVKDLSLRPLAERVGTSARLLIYHFDTKENLLARALEEVRARVAKSLIIRATHDRPTSLRSILMMFWEWSLEEDHASYFRLLFEVDGLSMFNHIRSSDETRTASASVWLTMIEGAVARVKPRDPIAQSQSTLVMAAMTGLLQDFLSTGDRVRTTAALDYLIRLIADADHPASIEEEA